MDLEEESAEPDQCVGGCEQWGRGGISVSIPKSHLLFLNDTSCVRVRGLRWL